MASFLSAHCTPELPGTGHSGQCMSISNAPFDQAILFFPFFSSKDPTQHPAQMSSVPPFPVGGSHFPWKAHSLVQHPLGWLCCGSLSSIYSCFLVPRTMDVPSRSSTIFAEYTNPCLWIGSGLPVLHVEKDKEQVWS